MILNENYNGKTTLKSWWKIVRDNFRAIAANAVSKKELSDSVSEAITQYVSEDMEALENVRQALEDNADVVQVLNSSITAINNHKADKANPHGVTKAQVGLGNVLNVEQASKEEFNAMAAAKSEVVFGTYSYGASTPPLDTETQLREAFINLGFRPKAVEIYAQSGEQYGLSGSEQRAYGGFAIDGVPCISTVYTLTSGAQQNPISLKRIEIVDNGFYVRDAYTYKNKEWVSATDMLYGLHFFKAYKYGSVVNVTTEGDSE